WTLSSFLFGFALPTLTDSRLLDAPLNTLLPSSSTTTHWYRPLFFFLLLFSLTHPSSTFC
ncbi:hypothetical protein COCCADRAFT_107828, partial [Bipolaris zeicola 26-R-13]